MRLDARLAPAAGRRHLGADGAAERSAPAPHTQPSGAVLPWCSAIMGTAAVRSAPKAMLGSLFKNAHCALARAAFGASHLLAWGTCCARGTSAHAMPEQDFRLWAIGAITWTNVSYAEESHCRLHINNVGSSPAYRTGIFRLPNSVGSGTALLVWRLLVSGLLQQAGGLSRPRLASDS